MPKLNFAVFLSPIVNELKALELGSLFNLEVYGQRFLSFHLLCGVFDKPARAATLNVKSVNCYYPCLKCMQEGTLFRLSTGSNIFEIRLVIH